MGLNETPIYMECENCFDIIPNGGYVHTALKREYNTTFGNFIERTRHLCCQCIKQVGGVCDGH